MDYEKQQQFNALRTTANVLIGFGGLIILISIFGLLGGISEMNDAYGVSAMASMVYVFSSATGILSGTVIIGLGQLLKCFMGVYENTWTANELLREQNEKLKKITG